VIHLQYFQIVWFGLQVKAWGHFLRDIVARVADQDKSAHASTLEKLHNLGGACGSSHPEQRPSFRDIVDNLTAANGSC
jgi:hypothetical protein